MRRLTASFLVATMLAGGALTGVALATPSSARPAEHVSSHERSASSRGERGTDHALHESRAGNRSTHERATSERDR